MKAIHPTILLDLQKRVKLMQIHFSILVCTYKLSRKWMHIAMLYAARVSLGYAAQVSFGYAELALAMLHE